MPESGNVFQAYKSTDGVAWRLVGSQTIQMTVSVYVGLAVTRYNTATATTARVDRTITAPFGNRPPVATLTSPGSDTPFSAPGTVDLAATASDPEGQLTRVEFYNGTTLLGSDTTAPISFSWANVPAGNVFADGFGHRRGRGEGDLGGPDRHGHQRAADRRAGQPDRRRDLHRARHEIGMTADASESGKPVVAGRVLNETAVARQRYERTLYVSSTNVAAGTYTSAGMARRQATETDVVGRERDGGRGGADAAPPGGLHGVEPITRPTSTATGSTSSAATANPATATPAATANLGNTNPGTNDITSDQSALFSNLAPESPRRAQRRWQHAQRDRRVHEMVIRAFRLKPEAT